MRLYVLWFIYVFMYLCSVVAYLDCVYCFNFLNLSVFKSPMQQKAFINLCLYLSILDSIYPQEPTLQQSILTNKSPQTLQKMWQPVWIEALIPYWINLSNPVQSWSRDVQDWVETGERWTLKAFRQLRCDKKGCNSTTGTWSSPLHTPCVCMSY